MLSNKKEPLNQKFVSYIFYIIKKLAEILGINTLVLYIDERCKIFSGAGKTKLNKNI